MSTLPVLAPVELMSVPAENPGPAAPATPPLPSPEFLAELREHSQRLETATPEEIIRWAVETYYPKLTMATAFGPEGLVIIYYLSKIEPRTHVFTITLTTDGATSCAAQPEFRLKPGSTTYLIPRRRRGPQFASRIEIAKMTCRVVGG
jgi:hypothetical protein